MRLITDTKEPFRRNSSHPKPAWKTPAKLILVSQQLLQIFYKTNHNDDGRPCQSDEEEGYDDLCNAMNDKIHTSDCSSQVVFCLQHNVRLQTRCD
jgi:hypothetical protein